MFLTDSQSLASPFGVSEDDLMTLCKKYRAWALESNRCEFQPKLFKY